MKYNNRLNNIQEYHFKRIDDIKEKLIEQGKVIYDFGIGDPDLPVDENIVEAMFEATKLKGFNKYPPYDGILELKLKVAEYYREVYDVKLSEDEVVILIGSKEGLNNIIPAVCDIGDTVIVPSPAYPVYSICSKLWGVQCHKLLLNEGNNYLPDFEGIPEYISSRSKLFMINYPNNPTGSVSNPEHYRALKKFCNRWDIVLCNDAAYAEILRGDDKPISILQENMNKNSIEFGTFSKTYNMTGFRIGYAVGDAEIIKALLKIKTNVDSGQFLPIQHAAIRALLNDRRGIIRNRRIYDDRLRVLCDIFKEKGIHYYQPLGTFYLWCSVPSNYSTDKFCEELLQKYGIIVTPGVAFGEEGNGFFRIALTKETNIIREAFDKIEVYN